MVTTVRVVAGHIVVDETTEGRETENGEAAADKAMGRR